MQRPLHSICGSVYSICKFILCQQEALRAGEIEVSPLTAVHKAALLSQTLLYQTLHARLNENDIQNFLKTVGFLQKYSDIKTRALGFDFEMCSAHVYSTKSKPFGKSICVGQF